MDGDDAVEFFEKFQREFRVDVSELRYAWPEFFGPEAVGLIVPIAGVGGIVGCVLLARFLDAHIGALPQWAWSTICIVGFLVTARYWLSWRKSPFRAITIADLIDAARAGNWPQLVEQIGLGERRYQ